MVKFPENIEFIFTYEHSYGEETPTDVKVQAFNEVCTTEKSSLILKHDVTESI